MKITHKRIGGVWLECVRNCPCNRVWVSSQSIAATFIVTAMTRQQYWRISPIQRDYVV